MKNEVQLIVVKGDETLYTSSLFGISTSLQKIYLDPETWLDCDAYEQLIAQNGFINVYGESGLLGTVQIDGAGSDISCESESGTLVYISDDPSAIADGAFFTFRLGSPKEVFLDLYENESISQNWNFTDISEFKVVGSYSRQFRIPLTQRNQEVLGAVSEVNYIGSQTDEAFFNTKIQAEIRVNTLPIINGHLRIIRAFNHLDR
jgi:hypothetical protein